ncbi:MAG: rRNA maturation RNase YbeY [Verrucomicrobiales bacterium]
MPSGPDLLVACHHPAIAWNVDDLTARLSAVLPALLALPGKEAPVLLEELGEVEISLVDDSTIARVHMDFMGVPGATDVITFQHGEIVISLDTAARVADELGRTIAEEVLLYCIHGLLHLQGYDDTTADARAAMSARQEELLALF